MPINKFRFVSPGVQVAEIDNSQLPATPADVGPTIIGRALRGPGLTPVRISSMSEFVEIFGMPQNGDAGNDPWRTGPDTLAPTYGAYAAQAYLRNSTPITYVRLLGRANDSNDGSTSEGVSALAGWKVPSPSLQGTGGAMGLFVFPSGTMLGGAGSGRAITAGDAGAQLTGTLAAVFYCSTGSVFLVGNDQAGVNISGTAAPVKCDSAGNLKAVIVPQGAGLQMASAVTPATSIVRDNAGANGSTLAPSSSILFNFNRSSKFYIRKAFNTNPTKTNTSLNDTIVHPEWLGETFQNNYDKFIGSAQGGPNSGSNFYAFVAPLQDSGDSINYGARNRNATKGKTPWTLGQNLNTSFYQTSDAAANLGTGKLFRLHTHNYGMWESQNLKVSITDIQAATNEFDDYGTFTVEIRMSNDSDEAPSLVEVFPNCNLNPNSENFIAKKIGDQYFEWDDTERRYRYYGDYVNQSKYMYVEITEEVRNGDTNPITLPFGFIGPVRFNGFTIYSGSSAQALGTAPPDEGSGGTVANTVLQLSPNSFGFLSSSIGGATAGGATGASGSGNFPGDIGGLWTGGYQMTASFLYPEFTTRSGSNEGNLNSPKDAYFGINTGRPGSFSTFDDSYIDLVRPVSSDITSATGDASQGNSEYSFIFTLDDLKYENGVYVWSSGSSQQSADAAASVNALSSSYNQVLSDGYDRFTMPILGGFHGLDITEMEPFNNNRALASGKTSLTSYAVNSAKMAVDVVSDPEFVEANMIVMPGVGGGNHSGNGGSQVQEHMLRTCERRADSMTILDLVGDYVPRSEYGNKYADNSTFRRPNVQTTVDKLNARAINSSYAASYYPWVQIQDSESGKNIWVPPSVVALGTYSSSQRKSAVWFAPAGFTRGGLTEGSSGLAVTAVKQKLISKDRDKLYSANINPIASFPAEGIVIFGQKTLQVTQSALDRVNVRRLMILVKRQISFMASRLLFEQNVQATWDRFTGQVAPFLDSIVAGNGLLDYKVVLDESTTTPDLIDRNIIYAKIYLKPARSVEFIAIDFIITRTGAAFED